MKKFIYLCGMMLLSLNIMAQIDLNDRNWDTVLIENFDESLSYWEWHQGNFSNSNYRWKAFLGYKLAPDNLNQLYQFENAKYDSINSTMNLIAEYDTLKRIPGLDFYLPTNGAPYPYLGNKYYFSGAIEYVKNIWNPDLGRFKYGYFEIRCKLPKHRGAFPAFWLHNSNQDTSDPYYEEIDIFEYTWDTGDPNATWHTFPNPNPTYPGDPMVITTGIYHNLNGQNVVFSTDTYARNYPRIPNGSDDVSGWHTYSCEWMPNHVYWYLDGLLINTYDDVTHIPCHPLALKTNYAINGYYDYGGNIWKETDIMTIHHINVYQLVWDCEKDETITCQSDLDNFPYAVKKSISITSSVGEPIVSSSDKVTFRVTDSFEITGIFEVQQGGEFTVYQQTCPESN